MNVFSYRLGLHVVGVLFLLLLAACGDSEAPKSKQKATFTPPIATAQPSAAIPPKLTREKVIEARRKYQLQVVSFDATQKFGTEFPYSDFVRLKITNRSDVSLPYLTVLTKRFDRNGRMIGSSRAPAIYVADLKPGQSAEVDYYPRGHLPAVKKITVEIEALISPDNEQFFAELPR